MEKQQIIELSAVIMEEIAQRLNNTWYQKLQGRIQIRWTNKPAYNAWALSNSAVNEPPDHTIVLTHNLALTIYEDAMHYCRIAQSELIKPHFKPIFGKTFKGEETTLPIEFDVEDCQHIMFVAAFTWVIFHELGHLTQEHGVIRRRFAEIKTHQLEIADCEIFGEHTLDQSAIGCFHATELAADFEAIDWCILDLMTTFSEEQYIPSVYMLVCGISCVTHRFYDGQPLDSEGKLFGTHPNPILRMEFILPHIVELLDSDIVREKTNHQTDRTALSDLLSKAAYSSVFYWNIRFQSDAETAANLLVKGMVEKSEVQLHLREIIRVWDTLSPVVKKVRRFGPPLSIMDFTDEIRNKLR